MKVKFSSLKYIPLSAIQAVRHGLYLSRFGYWHSLFSRKVEDQSGKPIPWLTYPAIELLSAMDFSQAHVLEFGAGHSTLWWAQRCRLIDAIETDPAWVKFVNRHELQNVIVSAVAPFNTRYDVVIIDGGDRVEHARNIDKYINEKAVVVADNADTWPQVIEILCAKLPKHRVAHLPGMAPINPVPHSTAIFLP